MQPTITPAPTELQDEAPAGTDQRILTEADVTRMIVEEGERRYLRMARAAQTRGQETSTKPGRILLETVITQHADSLKEWCRAAIAQPGRNHVSVKYLKMLDPEVAAFITCQMVLDKVSLRHPFLTSAFAVATAIEEEVRFSEVKKKLPAEWRRVERKVKTRNESHRRKVIKGAVSRMEAEWEPWPRKDKYQLGTVLIELFAVTTGLIEIENVPAGNKRNPKAVQSVIKPTADALEWIANCHDNHKARYPFYLPTVVPPEDWTGPRDGGYPQNIFMRWPLVQQSDPQARRVRSAGPDEMPEVYAAVNALQRTAWRVNDNVFAVFDYFWKNGIGIADVPAGDMKPIPEKPDDIATNPQAKRKWKQSASEAYEHNARLGAKRTLFGKIHFVARHYQHQEFWFPHKLDFRGRAYAIPGFLTPQGCSLAKGLLRFAEGKPLATDQARGWFMIHGANCWGVDKVTFAERIQWVNDNRDMILAIAEDPIGNRQWEEADGGDKAWPFLAWCFEYAAWQEDPAGFQSYIPVAMDGTNNGLQIYSLLLRDPVGAEATNVLPSAAPRDIYRDVGDRVGAMLRDETPKEVEDNPLLGAIADRVQDLLKEAGSKKHQMAQDWLAFFGERVPRQAVKRPVMVMPYGGTEFAVREYLEDWYEEEIKKRGLQEARPFPTTFNHTRFLTGFVMRAIDEIVVGARVGMEWLRRVAEIATNAGVPLAWTTPSGFRVHQAVVNNSKFVVKTKIGKLVRKRTARLSNGTLSKSGQINGLPPNFVHSLDATVMTKTVNACGQLGIASFSMIHDSFATHAADCPDMAQILRSEVASMFSANVLEDFANQVKATLPAGVELPPLPTMGSLDPSCVLSSPYFFA